MESELIKERTDILKKDINNLLINYCHETKLPVEAIQSVAQFVQTPNGNELSHFQTDIGVRL